MFLQVALSLLVFSLLGDVSIEGTECLPNMKNVAVYEGYENVLMNLTTDTNNVWWRAFPSLDESRYYTIQDNDGTRNPELTGLFYPNQSGLVILSATIITPNEQLISTAGLYIAQCANNENMTGAKLLVVRATPECSCNDSSPDVFHVSCTILYADHTIHPIYATMTWKINDFEYPPDTPARTIIDYYVFESTSTITVSKNLLATLTCTVTFNAPADPEYGYIATNAPEFSASCSVEVGQGGLTTTTTQPSAAESSTTISTTGIVTTTTEPPTTEPSTTISTSPTTTTPPTSASSTASTTSTSTLTSPPPPPLSTSTAELRICTTDEVSYIYNAPILRSRCYDDWSKCSLLAQLQLGIFWHTCQSHCKSKGFSYGSCVPSTSVGCPCILPGNKQCRCA